MIARALRAGQRGNTMAEFAIVLTASLMLIVGIVDFGRAMYVYHLISTSARLATRYAMVRGSTCTATACPATSDSIQTYVRSSIHEIDPASVTATTTWSSTSMCAGVPYQSPGCQVSVQVNYSLHLFAVPLLPAMTMPISSTSTMIIAQ